MTKLTNKTTMTWERLLGLCQTDGSFSIQICSDGGIRPIIVVTITGKRPDLIDAVMKFYKANGMSPQLQQFLDFQRGDNVRIEGKRDTTKFINCVETVFNSTAKVALVGRKGIDYQLFKKAVELANRRSPGPSSLPPEVRVQMLKPVLYFFH